MQGHDITKFSATDISFEGMEGKMVLEGKQGVTSVENGLLPKAMVGCKLYTVCR
jgi:hypothetical protein